ncbi:hypothetical protein N2152v2_000558 [Parachlorella kessleri]
MHFSNEHAEALYRVQYNASRVRPDQIFAVVEVAVSLLLTLITGLQPQFWEALSVLWAATLATLLIACLSVLQPRLYIAQRTYLMVAARALLALLIPQFVYLLAITPYKGSSMVTPSFAGFCGVWFWNTRWLGEQVSALGFTNPFSVELVLVPASVLVDILNNPRL